MVLVIGNAPTIGKQIFDQGYSLAAVIANEFGEAASTPVYSSALFAAGLLLFVVTLIINALARQVVKLGDPEVRARRARRKARRAARAAAEGSVACRYLIDVMTGVPSVVFGLFIYVTLVETQFGSSGLAAWKGSIAISLLMLPIVARSSEVVLLLLPDGLRESALALGAPRWRVISRIVLPTAAAGLLTGSLLAIARGAGETAPPAVHRPGHAGQQHRPVAADEQPAHRDL